MPRKFLLVDGLPSSGKSTLIKDKLIETGDIYISQRNVDAVAGFCDTWGITSRSMHKNGGVFLLIYALSQLTGDIIYERDSPRLKPDYLKGLARDYGCEAHLHVVTGSPESLYMTAPEVYPNQEAVKALMKAQESFVKSEWDMATWYIMSPQGPHPIERYKREGGGTSE